MIDPKEAAKFIGQIKEIAVRRNMQDLLAYPAVFAEYMFRDESSEQILKDATTRYALTLSNEQQDAFAEESTAIQELFKTNPDTARERLTTQLLTVYAWYNITLAERIDDEPLGKDSRVKKAVVLILSQQMMDESISALDPDSDE